MNVFKVDSKHTANMSIQRIIASGFLLGILAYAASSMAHESPEIKTTEVSSTSSDTSQELYRLMFEARMIDPLAYQYAIVNGKLPGDFTLQNSSIPPEKKDTWSDLYAKGIVSAAELVQILGEGRLDDLSPREMQAFEDLAPVYEPDKTRRIRYDVRKKHIIVDLIRLEHEQRRQVDVQRQAGIEAAKRLGMPGGDGEKLKNSAITGRSANGFPIYAVSHNRQSAEEIEADTTWGTFDEWAFNLSGAGVKIALRDIHLSTTNHQEFGVQRVSQKVSGTESEHATAVCGTICASGIDTNAHGMANNAQVDSYVFLEPMYFSDLLQSSPSVHIAAHTYGVESGWSKVGSTYVWYDWTFDASSSNESGSFGRYEYDTESLDATTYAAAYVLPVISVGNDKGESYAGQWHFCSYYGVYTNDYHPADGAVDNGYDTLNPLACAKNALVVGATPRGFSSPASYSSCGPTDDGRIKPDVTAPGGPVYTTSDNGTNQYTTLEGSSFASATVAGTLAMLQELHERGYGSGQPMLASTWRALLMHTADGGDIAGPDYRTGWGQINAFEAAKVVSNNMSYASLPHIKELRLLDGESIEFDVVFATGGWHRVSMAWTDPPGESNAEDWTLDGTNLVLVNDLDLRVINPNGVTNFPMIRDPWNLTNTFTTGDDFRNNYEQVGFQLTAGTNRVCISHKGSLLDGMQDVSVIITDNIPGDAPEFRISDIGPVDSSGELVALRWPGVVGGRYDVQSSTNLTLHPAGWSTVGPGVIANSTNLVWTNAVIETIQFFRLNRIR